MKISLYIQSLRGGGSERVFTILANQFSKKNLKVDLLLSKKIGPNLKRVKKNVNIINFNSPRSSIYIFDIIPFLKYLKEKNTDVIISTGLTNLTTMIGKKISSIDKPFIIRINNYSCLKKTKPRNFYKKLFYKNTDYVVAISKRMKRDMIKTFQISKDKVKIIYNPIDIKKINKNTEKKAELK